jgi:ATP sulfurylase
LCISGASLPVENFVKVHYRGNVIVEMRWQESELFPMVLCFQMLEQTGASSGWVGPKILFGRTEREINCTDEAN